MNKNVIHCKIHFGGEVKGSRRGRANSFIGGKRKTYACEASPFQPPASEIVAAWRAEDAFENCLAVFFTQSIPLELKKEDAQFFRWRACKRGTKTKYVFRSAMQGKEAVGSEHSRDAGGREEERNKRKKDRRASRASLLFQQRS